MLATWKWSSRGVAVKSLEIVLGRTRLRMIVGVGIDMVEVVRIEASISRFGERFLTRLFTPAEQKYCVSRNRPAQHFAARFAAKEAAAKALGTGFNGEVGWLDFEVVSAVGKPPRLLLHGGAARVAAGLGEVEALLSLTHTDSTAGAVAVIQRVSGAQIRKAGVTSQNE